MPPRPLWPRAELIELVERLDETRLCLVVAPAGSGKSVLLRVWSEELRKARRAVCLIELGDLHADACGLGAVLTEALDRVLPGSFSSSISFASQIYDADRGWPALARALVRDLDREGPPLFVLLDGAEALPPGGSGEALLDALVRAAPARLRLVVAGRRVGVAAAARLRVSGELLEVGGDDLSLRASAVASLLEQAGVEPAPALVASVLGHTEGWATGVALAARILSGSPSSERERTLSELARRSDLFAYFSDELLRREGAPSESILEAAALLGEGSAAEIAEVAGDPVDAASVRELADRGLLGHAGGDSFSLSSLWRAFFRERVGARRAAGEARELRRRAAQVLARGGRLDEAIALTIEAEDFEAATALLSKTARFLNAGGRRARILDWIMKLPPELRERDAEVVFQSGLALFGRDPERSAALLERASQMFEASGAGAEARSAWSALAFLHLTEGRLEAFRALTRRRASLKALVTDPEQRGALLVGLAGRAHLAGRFSRSLRLSEAAAAGPLPLVARWLNGSNRILIHAQRGETKRACALAEEALEDRELSRFVLATQSLRILHAMTRVTAASREERRLAVADAREAVDALGDLGFERTRMVASLALGQTAAAAGDVEVAAAAFEEAADLTARAGHAALEAAARAGLALVRLCLGDEVGAHETARASCSAYETLFRKREAVFPWALARALWVCARTGAAAMAFDVARRHERAMLGHDAPQLAHTAGLLLADVARLAGRRRDAERLACRAWATSERAGLVRGDLDLVPEVEAETAALALARGVAADHLVDRLRRTDPSLLAGLLERSLHDANASLRRTVAAQMGRLADRRFHEPLSRVSREDPDPKTRSIAADALAKLDPRPRHGLRFETFGAFRAFRGDIEIPEREWRGQTSRRLLFRLLAAAGRPLRRETLLEDLWPETAPEPARNHLRVAVSRLHDVLEPDRPQGVAPTFVQTEGDALRIPADVRIDWDVRRFEEALDALGEAFDRERARTVFESAAGPLLPDLGPEGWLEELRARVAERWSGLGHALAHEALEQGDLDACERYAGILVGQDVSDERAWATRVRVRLLRGERAAALRLYREAAASLRRSVDAAPGAELEALAARARSGG